MRATSPTGVPIIGTLERTPGCATTVEDSFKRNPDGSIEYDHSGRTEMYWDDQWTVERQGKTIFVDENGEEWAEDKIFLVDGEAVA